MLNAQYSMILVIDIGSSSTRASLYTTAGELVEGSMAREKSALSVNADGAALDDAQALLGRATRCVDACLAAAGPLASEIVAVGCATYVSNVVGLDASGQPLTPVYTYADTRGAEAAAALRERLDEQAVLQRTGCPLRTSYLPALLAWLAAAEPQTFAAVRRWAGVGEWLYAELLGEGAISYSAAAWTGLLDRRRLVWDGELLAALGIQQQQLGTLLDLDRPVGTLRRSWAERWPALAQVPWFAAIGDGAAANVGSGCVSPDRIALSVGTTGALRVITAATPERAAAQPGPPVVPRGLWCYRVDCSAPLLGGATSEGGSVLDWARRTLQISTPALDSYLLDPRGDGHDLVVLPFISGERSPGWSGDRTMLISGINLATTPLDLARASLEAVAYRWAAIADLLRSAVPQASTVVASGGGLKYVPNWAQVIADALGMPVTISDETETTSRGVALLTLRTLGLLGDIGSAGARLGRRFEPDPARHARHLAAMERQRALYQSDLELKETN